MGRFRNYLHSTLDELFARTRISKPISRPCRIVRSGNYFLLNDLNVDSGDGIFIAASNVQLDLNGKRIFTKTNPTSQATGIFIAAKDRVSICNGTIEGFHSGIVSPDTSHMRIERVNIRNTLALGLKIGGDSGMIVSNVVSAISGNSVEAYAVGIIAQGANTTIIHNFINEIYRQPGSIPESVGEGVGILISAEAECSIISRNILENNSVSSNTIGIWVGSAASHEISNNIVVNFRNAVQAASGSVLRNILILRKPIAGSTGVDVNDDALEKIDANVVVGFDTAIFAPPSLTGDNLSYSSVS